MSSLLSVMFLIISNRCVEFFNNHNLSSYLLSCKLRYVVFLKITVLKSHVKKYKKFNSEFCTVDKCQIFLSNNSKVADSKTKGRKKNGRIMAVCQIHVKCRILAEFQSKNIL